MVITDLRRVKRQGDSFTVFNRAALDSSKDSLCDHCGQSQKLRGFSQCSIFQYMTRKEKNGYDMTVKHCRHFMFPIHFNDITGTDLALFNTFRVGEAWSKRIEKGFEIALSNDKGEVYGFARVDSVSCGKSSYMLKEHADYNHLLLNQGYTKKESAERLERVLRNAYGKKVFESAGKMTVIYLRRFA